MLRRFVQRLGHRRWFAAVGARILPPLDRAMYRLSGRRWMVSTVAFPALLLHQGTNHPVPLLFARDGGGYLVAATNWGRPHHPLWSTRLLAGKVARVEIAGHAASVAVQRLSSEEVDAVWPRLLEVWPAFETYRHRAQRDVRVFRLLPD
jgi:deazaflavin-dependent oxidoreductase (nitroreductase family)